MSSSITSGPAGDSKGVLARYNFRAKAVKHLPVFKANLNVVKEGPVSVVIHPTNACNAKCPMCRYADLRETNETIPLDVMKRTVKELGEMGTKSIIFSGGGEPVIYNGLAEVVEIAASYGIKMGLVTNLIRLNPQLMNAIVDNFSWVRVSINAATAETYQIVQGMDPKVWPNLMENLRVMVDKRNKNGSKLVVGGGFIVQRGNYKEVGDFVDLCTDLGLDYAMFRPIQKWSPTAALTAGSLALTKEMLDELKSIITTKISSNTQKWCDNNLAKAAELFVLVDAIKDYPKCHSALVESAIGGDGSLYPCCQHVGNVKFASGNILQKTFKEIWTDPDSKRLYETIDPKICPPCRYDYYNRVFNDYEKGWRPSDEEVLHSMNTPDSDFM